MSLYITSISLSQNIKFVLLHEDLSKILSLLLQVKVKLMESFKLKIILFSLIIYDIGVSFFSSFLHIFFHKS